MTKEKILEIISNIVGEMNWLDEMDTLQNNAINSLVYVQILVNIEDEYNIEFSDDVYIYDTNDIFEKWINQMIITVHNLVKVNEKKDLHIGEK